MRRPSRHPHVIMVAAAMLIFTSCGVSFSDGFEGTELFKTMWLTSGDRGPLCERQGDAWVCPPSGMVTVNVGITNGYPVPVKVSCFYEDPDAVTDDQEKLTFQERARSIGEKVLEPAPGSRPSQFAANGGDKEPKEVLSFSFPAPPAGSYFLACLTPAAADNGLGLTFKIKG